MAFTRGALEALEAVIREGSFERAASALHVTPSAVSQRIKQLETQVGATLVVRGTPCVTTPVGASVYRHAQQVALLEADLLRSIAPELDAVDGETVAVSMAIAANADSLATWLMPALKDVASQPGLRVEVVIDDEQHTTSLLRDGRVLGAVTAERRPVQGCRVFPLGTMRYLAQASPGFVQKWFPEGPTAEALSRAPSLAYNRKDDATEQFLNQQLGLGEIPLRAHHLPSPHAYLDACLGGLGWGLNPEPLGQAAQRRGRLVELFPDRCFDVPLYWQQWSISSPRMEALAEALRARAAERLHPVVHERSSRRR